jgi:Tfp pilus assembly protein PilE
MIRAGNKTHHKNFSYIELLIIVAVLLILATIVLPTFSRAREVAYRAECANNLANIGKTFQTHFSDHNGKMPYYNWMIGAYMRDSYQCPKDDLPKIMNFYDSQGTQIASVNYSYGFNASTDNANILRIANPSKFTTSFDAGDLYDFSPAANGDSKTKNAKTNNGHGNNKDGVDSSNPGKSKQGEDTDDGFDDEIKDKGGSTSSNPYDNWSVDANGVAPDDTDSWYYQNLKFRHLNTACHLFLDGTVKVEHNPLDLESLMVDF